MRRVLVTRSIGAGASRPSSSSCVFAGTSLIGWAIATSSPCWPGAHFPCPARRYCGVSSDACRSSRSG